MVIKKHILFIVENQAVPFDVRVWSEALFAKEIGFDVTVSEYQKLLEQYGMICSMSRKGDCWDNAVVESFFHSLKTEWTADIIYQTRDDARSDVMK